MALHDDVAKLAQARRLTDELQGVSKAKIREVLGKLDLAGNPDVIDAVFALLDDQTASWFSKPPKGARFCDGATRSLGMSCRHPPARRHKIGSRRS